MEPTQGSSKSPEDRLHRRRIRRWKRRARIAGPFLGISMLLATLSLSVDLIEYQPREDAPRLSDRPIHLDNTTSLERTARQQLLVADSVASTASVIPERDSKISADLLSLDLTLPSSRVARSPTQPLAPR